MNEIVFDWFLSVSGIGWKDTEGWDLRDSRLLKVQGDGRDGTG